jgi:hypothetical protein
MSVQNRIQTAAVQNSKSSLLTDDHALKQEATEGDHDMRLKSFVLGKTPEASSRCLILTIARWPTRLHRAGAYRCQRHLLLLLHNLSTPNVHHPIRRAVRKYE